MKSIWAIATFVILSLSTSNAGLTFQWEVDLTTYAGSYDSINGTKQYSDGSIAVGILTNSYADTVLLVFNSDGSLKMSDAIGYECDIEGFSSSPNYIYLEGWDPLTEIPFLMIYEIHDDSFTVTSITSGFESTRSSDAGIDPSVIYTIEGTFLRKYQMSSPPAALEAAVASGIDGSNYIMNWNSMVGGSYQIQSSTNLIDWVDIGSPIAGTGSPLTWANALTNSKSFFRIINN